MALTEFAAVNILNTSRVHFAEFLNCVPKELCVPHVTGCIYFTADYAACRVAGQPFEISSASSRYREDNSAALTETFFAL